MMPTLTAALVVGIVATVVFNFTNSARLSDGVAAVAERVWYALVKRG
jgi:hypothetical protein